ncbi:MAG: glycine cleavage system protein H [Chloroflexi bacterium]|nr:glycine cleavage system protein H [Chloroflexota bacterium]
MQQHVWVRPEDDGTITVGMTDAAQHIAGKVIIAMPKKVGRKVKKGRSAGTVESGKWVGPIKSPVNGLVVEANDALRADPSPLNTDPYGGGWFVRIEPSDWAGESGDLLTGSEAVAAYDAFLKDEGIDCGG